MNVTAIVLSFISVILLILSGSFIGLYFNEKHKIENEQNCIALESNWKIFNEINEYENQTVPIEVLLINSTYKDEPFLGYNDRKFRPQMNTEWVFSNVLPKGTKNVHIEKFRGLGSVKINGREIQNFFNEFQEMTIDLSQETDSEEPIIVNYLQNFHSMIF